MWNKIWKNLEWILLGIGTIVMITASILLGFGILSAAMFPKIFFSGILIAVMGIPIALNAGR